ncbi:MAG: hypothetical protein ACOY95_03130 [Pseudomonadota bacterium]
MTIASEDRKAGPFPGDGVTVNFDFEFKVFAETDVLVIQAVTATGAETEKTITTDYTVTLNPNQESSPGGRVTMLVAPPAGQTITLTSEVPNLQGKTITSLGGFFPQVLNDALDRLTVLVQQVRRDVARSVKVNLSSTTTPDQLLADINNSVLAADASAAAAAGSAVAADASADAAALSASASSADLATAESMLLAAKLGAGADIASAATVDFTARTGNLVIVTGTNIVTAATMANGDDFYAIAAGALPINIAGVLVYTCSSGDMLHFTQDRLGVQRIRVLRANDTPQYGECRLAKDGSSLKLSPYKGNKITIGGRVETVPSAGVTLSASGLTPSTLYYIYAYMNSGTMTLEASTTAYATDATTGVTIKSGDATRTLVGMARPITGPAWADTAAQRFVRSWFNDPGVACTAAFTAGRSTSSGTYVELNTEIRNEFLVWAGEKAQISTEGYQLSGGAGNTYTSVGIDGTTAEDTCVAQSNPADGFGSANCTLQKTGLAEGYHYATLLAKVDVSSATWAGSATPGARCVVQTRIGARP